MSDESNGTHDSKFRIMRLGDDFGAPIMLAVRAPGQVAAQPDSSGAVVRRGAVSGNPNFDPITGKFAGRRLRNLQVVAQTLQQGAPVLHTGTPNGVNPLVWAKRMAYVREAARSMQQLDINSLRGFLDGKVVDVNQVDLNSFMADVQWQRMADLADILDAQIRTKQPVRVLAPKQWVKRIFLDLTAAEGVHLVKTLEGKGWSPEQIRENVVKKIRNKDLRAQLDQLYGEAPAPQGKPLVKAGQ